MYPDRTCLSIRVCKLVTSHSLLTSGILKNDTLVSSCTSLTISLLGLIVSKKPLNGLYSVPFWSCSLIFSFKLSILFFFSISLLSSSSISRTILSCTSRGGRGIFIFNKLPLLSHPCACPVIFSFKRFCHSFENK